MKVKIVKTNSSKGFRFFKDKFDKWTLIFIQAFGYTLWIRTTAKLNIPTFEGIKYSIRRWKRRTTEALEHDFRMAFGTAPIYYELFSRDCDMCESTSYGKFETYKSYYNWLSNPQEWEWVEGATSVNIVTEDEYLDNVGHTYIRDRVLEAYENGRGNSIYV